MKPAIALATAWRPRGELSRFLKLAPQLKEVYATIAISLPPGASPEIIQLLEALPQVRAAVTTDWSHGRHAVLQLALETPVDYIQYADFDRILRWVETRPAEWLQVVSAIQECDCLIIGRTPAAAATHPHALANTERISNQVTSYLLGQEMDVSAGSKGFSRRAAEFLIKNSPPGRALGMDAEWPVLLKRAGFEIQYRTVDGLDWESADRYQDEAADPDSQRRAAEAYDADPQNWAHRVEIAREIIEAGLEAEKKEMGSTE